jgi:hypothetical protein
MFKYRAHTAEWKVANCVVVPKQGKATCKDSKSYRPISLLSCFGKVLESLTAQRVTKAAEECLSIMDTQMGGRENYSAVDALINILTLMSQSLRRRDKYPNPKSRHRRTHQDHLSLLMILMVPLIILIQKY